MANIDTTRKGIAHRLKEARRLAGLSQSQVATLLKLQRPAISEIEAGRRKVSAEELTQFSQIYDVTVSWLTSSDFEDAGIDEIRIELVARELSKLKEEDVKRLLFLLGAMRGKKDGNDEP